MVFSSPIFLFLFLPVLIGVYHLSTNIKHKNITLLLFSLGFYFWGENKYIGVMLLSLIINFIMGLLVSKYRKKSTLFIAVASNLLILFYFKYSDFFIANLNKVFETLNLKQLTFINAHLPLGISFFTFQAISYQIDVYRREIKPQKNFFSLSLFISLFPQLIAGPIVRYKDIYTQLKSRTTSANDMFFGLQRFIFGLSKKILIANSLGSISDQIFNLPNHEVSLTLSWLGIVCYSLQIYFDFSGYSDMAIGLGRMFGFHFLENFNYPYSAKSITDFWRRWHISLSTWFRDYLYIPLGGNRVSKPRLYLNLFIVFILCGLWHGASWNFVIWGGLHGLLLTAERLGLKFKGLFSNLTTLFFIMITWVFFRAETLSESLNYLSSMFSYGKPIFYSTREFLSVEGVLVLFAGLFLSQPICNNFLQFEKKISFLRALWIVILLFLSIVKLSTSTYNPFIYFRF